jgi:hydroxyacylglutathione hydrolase
MTTVSLIPVLNDNYAYFLEADSGACAIVDPGEAGPVIAFLDERALRPSLIFNTHHHSDHTGGNAALISRYGCDLAAPASEKARIPGITIPLTEGTALSFGGESLRVLETPGHTAGHICLYFPQSGLLFSGDTLFSMGCGRLFEGTAAQMWDSLGKIMALPDETQIFCGHEYTLTNGKFCLRIEPGNNDLQSRIRAAEGLRAEGKPTLPVTLALEKETNVFLRAGSAARFAELRLMKDKE